MILGRNKIYWFVASFLALTIILCLYILEGVNREEKDRIRDLSYLVMPTDGEFYFGKDKIHFSDIRAKVERLEKELGADYVVHIRTSESVRFDSIIDIVQAVQETGHTKIGIETIVKPNSWFGAIKSEIQILAQGCTAIDNKPAIEIEQTDNENVLIKLNAHPILLGELSDALRRMLQKTDDKTICIRAITKLPYGRVAEILDAAKRAGAENIRLMVDKATSIKH